jgi:hypothetical protein
MPSFDQLPESDNLLTQILAMVTTLNTTVESFEPKLIRIEADLAESIKRIDAVIKDGFPEGDLIRHKNWHLRNFITRLFK